MDPEEVATQDSILKTIRQMIGPSAEYDVFDTDLIIDINTAFSRLCQLGVGPTAPFRITGETETWNDFATEWRESDIEHENAVLNSGGCPDDVKQYVYLKTRMIFDTPASATVVNAHQAQIDLLEWTLKEVARFGY